MNGVTHSDPQPERLIADAAQSGSTVTITLTDGRVLTGTLHPHAVDPALWTVRSGSRGRPPVFHPDDVEELIYE